MTMTPQNWTLLLWLAVCLYLLLTTGLLALTLYQRRRRRQMRESEQQAAAWFASFKEAAESNDRTVRVSVTGHRALPEENASDLLGFADYLLPVLHQPDNQDKSVHRTLLTRELRRALLPFLVSELPQTESLPRARRRQIILSLRLLAHAPAPKILPLLLSLLTLRDRGLAGEALSAIGHGAPTYEAATVPLTGLIRDEAPRKDVMVLAAHWALSKLLEAHPRNLTLLANDPVASIRQLVMTTSGRQKHSSELVTILRRGVKDSDPAVRAAAFRSLIRMAPSDSPKLIQEAMEDPEEDVPLVVFNNFVPVSEPGVLQQLVEAFANAPTRAGRAVAAALASLSAPLDTHLAQQLSNDPSTFEMLGHLGRPELAQRLTPWLDHHHPRIRGRTARTLAALARSAYPEFLDQDILDDLLLRFANEQDPQALEGLIDAVAFAADARGTAALMEKISHTGSDAQKKRLVEAIAVLQLIRHEARE